MTSQQYYKATFASSVVRMKQEPITTGTVEATNVVMTEMITDKIFIISVSTFIYICRKKKREQNKETEIMCMFSLL